MCACIQLLCVCLCVFVSVSDVCVHVSVCLFVSSCMDGSVCFGYVDAMCVSVCVRVRSTKQVLALLMISRLYVVND